MSLMQQDNGHSFLLLWVLSTTPLAPLLHSCRTFAAAIAATTAKGEVIVLDSGGYGKVITGVLSTTMNNPFGDIHGMIGRYNQRSSLNNRATKGHMPRRNTLRFTAYVDNQYVAKLDAVCKHVNVARASLFELLLLGLSEDSIALAVAEGKKVRESTRVDLRKKRGAALSQLHSLSADQLEALLKMIEATQARSAV